MAAPRRPAGEAFPDAGYDERLTVPWWWWPFAVAVAALLSPELYLGFSWPVAVAVEVVLTGAALAVPARASLIRVRVGDGRLSVGGRSVSLTALGVPRVLDARQTRRGAGPARDPAAVTAVRAWMPGSVLLPVVEPAEPAPYWLVSSRHPQRLADAVRSARPNEGAGEPLSQVPAPRDDDLAQPQPR